MNIFISKGTLEQRRHHREEYNESFLLRRIYIFFEDVRVINDLFFIKMLIKEYRIPLPLTVEEYQIAQLYMIAVNIFT